MSYGDRLAKALVLANKSRAELADALKISVQAVGQVLRGKTGALTAENSMKAAQFLRVDPAWLAAGQGEPRTKRVFSPMALDLAAAFDKLPIDKRDRVYAMAMNMIDFASAVPVQEDRAAARPMLPPVDRT